MKPRQFRRIHEGNSPVRGETNIPVPNKPGLFAGKERRNQYEEELSRREEDQRRLERLSIKKGERNREIAESNRRAAERRLMMKNLPNSVKENIGAQIAADRLIDMAHVGRSLAQVPGQIPGYAYGAAAATLASAGLLNAFAQQQQEGLGTGPISTAARATNNLFNGPGVAFNGGVGVDPLAMARNNVADAQAYVGSPRMLEALVLDQMENNTVEEVAKNIEFEQEVTRLAEYLLTVPSRNAEGNTIYMRPGEAYSQARQIIEGDLTY